MIPAIIIARGGSQRLPRKNTMLLCNRPLVEWSIVQARNSHEISSVWLSTDDEEIAEIGYRNGATIIHEAPRLNGPDRPPGSHAVLNAINTLIGYGQKFDVFLSILPTAVCWKPDDFDWAIRLFLQLDAQCLGPKYNPTECVVNEKMPYNQMRRVLFGKNKEYLIGSEQWGIGNVEYYRKYVREMPQTDIGVDQAVSNLDIPEWMRIFHYYPIEWWQQFDIDTIDDFQLQELLMERYILGPLGEDCYERYGMDKRKREIAAGRQNSQNQDRESHQE